MRQDDYILEALGAMNYPDDKKALIIEQVNTLVGEAISAQLSEQQLNEYQAIIDANDDVIQAWLNQNIPEYKNSYLYQEFEAGYKNDPERNDPAKLYASMAWIELNVKNGKEVTDKVIAEYKEKYMPTP